MCPGSRITLTADSQSYSASDRDTVSGVNVDTDVKVEYQPFPCEYYHGVSQIVLIC